MTARRRSSLMVFLGQGEPSSPVEIDTDTQTEEVARRLAAATQRRPLSRFVLIGVLGLFILIFSVTLPNSFPTTANLNAILMSQSVTLILATGLLLALRSGDFDLSVAATMTLSASLVAVLTVQRHVAVIPAVGIALLVSLIVGLVNGVLIVYVGLDGFIATLGMQTLLGGLALGVTNGEVIAGIPTSLVTFGTWSIGPIPGVAIYGWVLVVLLWYVLDKTPMGRHLLFIGGDRRAAELLALPVKSLRLCAFVGCSVFAGFAGVVLAGTQGSVDPTAGPEFLLPAYAAAFLGTATIQLGRFNAIGTVIALYVLVVGVVGLELAGAPSWIGNVFNGGALICALMIARLFSHRETRAVVEA